jgi:DNA-binding response OmpR family regulator
MPSRPPGDNEGARVGGARADFVASLGRKLNDARDLLALLEEDPASSDGRDELRRRLHALGTGARLLRFDAMTHSLQEALAVLDRGAQGGGLREEDVDFVAQVLDDLPALAWGEVRSREVAAAGGEIDSASDTRGPVPVAALVVGDESLAEALGDDGPTPARVFECERTEDTDAALGLARAHAPDVLVVDADLPKARELIEALLDDPLTDPVPVVVVGAFPSQEEVARYVALGVARTLTKPFGPELLRATCDELVDHRDGRTLRMTLGEPTLEQLADRLADELRRALVDGVDTPARSHRVPLGEGTEVLGALWGAIARVQEIITHKTGGAVRFGGETPEGAIALAPWLQQEVSGADRVPGRGRGAAAEVRLDGRRVVVADDDPGVTWFISDLLRTAGCDVHEALDGTTALALAFRLQPELVVSDILMPGIDGFALCRALRRDVALRDTPVILLSWKEDLLQRVRELGASAAAYMRKESGSRAILARVREVLRPRARIESRLRAEGEVRGRLDGLTPRVLLELVCSIRDDARLSVRDATYLYEVEVRAGAPRKVTRTATDGSYRSGERAMASLLGVGAGRFVVTSSLEPVRGELSGSLFEQLVRPIATARGALAATAGAATAGVERISFDAQSLDAYLSATPEPTRTLIRRIAEGASPRKMLLGGDVSPSLLEDVLSDLASRGAIESVRGLGGADLLTPAVEDALALLQGTFRASESKPASGAVGPSSGRGGEASARPAAIGPAAAGDEEATYSVAPDDNDAPHSLEDAVMREISDGKTEQPAVRAPAPDLPSIIETSELRRRSSNPPPPADVASAPRMLTSIPPDAVVPSASTSEDPILAAAAAERAGETTERVAPKPHLELAPDADLPSDPPPAPPPKPAPAPRTASFAPPAKPRPSGVVPVLGLLGSILAGILYWAHTEGGKPAAGSDPAPADSSTPVASASAPPAASSAPETVATHHGPAPADDDLPPGAEVPAGFGLLEIDAPPRTAVRVDGVVAGSGPFVASVARPGYHEVRVGDAGRDTKHLVEVRAGKRTRVRAASSP